MTHSNDHENQNNRHMALSGLSLFTSLGTLVCCALPALLVTLGAGAALAGLVSTVPQLIILSEYKVWVFGLSGGLLAVSGYLQWRGRRAPCPIDPDQARTCGRLRRFSLWLYFISVGIYAVGFFFAFIAVHIFY